MPNRPHRGTDPRSTVTNRNTAAAAYAPRMTAYSRAANGRPPDPHQDGDQADQRQHDRRNAYRFSGQVVDEMVAGGATLLQELSAHRLRDGGAPVADTEFLV